MPTINELNKELNEVFAKKKRNQSSNNDRSMSERGYGVYGQGACGGRPLTSEAEKKAPRRPVMSGANAWQMPNEPGLSVSRPIQTESRGAISPFFSGYGAPLAQAQQFNAFPAVESYAEYDDVQNSLYLPAQGFNAITPATESYAEYDDVQNPLYLPTQGFNAITPATESYAEYEQIENSLYASFDARNKNTESYAEYEQIENSLYASFDARNKNIESYAGYEQIESSRYASVDAKNKNAEPYTEYEGIENSLYASFEVRKNNAEDKKNLDSKKQASASSFFKGLKNKFLSPFTHFQRDSENTECAAAERSPTNMP